MKLKAISLITKLPAQIIACRVAIIGLKVGGMLLRRACQEGAMVREGKLLATDKVPGGGWLERATAAPL